MKKTTVFLYLLLFCFYSNAQVRTIQQAKPVNINVKEFKNFTKREFSKIDKQGNGTCYYAFDLNDANEPKKSFEGTYSDKSESKAYIKHNPGTPTKHLVANGKLELKDGVSIVGTVQENTYDKTKDPEIIFTANKYFFNDGTTYEINHYYNNTYYIYKFSNGDWLKHSDATSWSSAEIKYEFANGDIITTANFENDIPKNGYGTFTPKDKSQIYGTFLTLKEGLLEFRANNENFTIQFSFDDPNKCLSGNCIDGIGKKEYTNGNLYEGEFKNGSFTKGKLITKNGAIYEGEFSNNILHGQGRQTAKDDKGREYTYTGNFAYGKFYGKGNTKGRLVYADGENYEGEFSADKPNGQGELTAKDYEKTYTYIGTFKDGAFFGNGVQTYADGTIYKSDKWQKTNSFSEGYKTENGKTVYGKRSDIYFIEEKNPQAADEMTARLNKAFGVGIQTNALKTDSNLKTYVFQSICVSGSNRFNVISKITANPNKHNFEEVKNEALRVIKQNAWHIQSELKYLGYAEDVKINGKPGVDYSVSEGSFYDF